MNKTLGQIAYEARHNGSAGYDWDRISQTAKLEWESAGSAVEDEVLSRLGAAVFLEPGKTATVREEPNAVLLELRKITAELVIANKSLTDIDASIDCLHDTVVTIKDNV